MKKYAHLVCLLVLAGGMNGAFAQKTYRVPNSQRYFVGIKAGALASWPVFTDPDLKNQYSSSPVGGFNVAALINFSLKKNFSFQSEFGYSQMGRSVTFNSGQWTNTSHYQMLDFSVLLRRSFRLKIGKDIPANWYFNIGPNIKYWISGKGEIDAGGNPVPYTIVFDGTSKSEYDHMYYNNVNRWLFGADIGVGANLGTFKGQQVMAEVRFTWGHTFLGNKGSAGPQSINLLGFDDSLLCNLKVLSFTLAYTLDFYTGQAKMGKSTHQNIRKKK